MRELSLPRAAQARWREVPEPEIERPEDAVVRPITATTCDLDTAIIRGDNTVRKVRFTVGHRCIAEVADVGPGATQFYRGAAR